MARVLMVASEAAPFAKTGGLADVVGALSAALRARGQEVAVALPRYRSVALEGAERVHEHLSIWLAAGAFFDADIWRTAHREVPYFFIDCPPLYDRAGIYGEAADYPDNHVRFAVLCQAALALVRYHWRPDVLHCHDWQTALLPVYIRTRLAGDPTFMGLRTLLTLHNLGYQGIYPKTVLPEIGLDESLFHPDALEFFGEVNLLKGGIRFADALNAVSPTYAREIQTPELGFGLDGVLRARGDALTGILNGADYEEWNPEADPHLPARYSAADLSGKRVVKQELLAEMGLPAEALARPLVGMVSRLDSQKGFDLLQEAAAELAAEDLSLVALVTGAPRWEGFLRAWAAAHPEKIAIRVAYDEGLAHRVIAGADLLLVPSRYEPCGLTQIYALRYGTVPVVRATGGLADTVDEATGFSFREYTVAALLEALRRALAAYREPDGWRERMRLGMARDFSWNASAARYSELYRSLAEP